MKQPLYFYEKIYDLRKRAGYTQLYVGTRLHIGRQTYANYEQNKRTPPLSIIQDLAKLYHVSVDYLVKDDPLLLEFSNARVHLSGYDRQVIRELVTLPDSRKSEVYRFVLFLKQESLREQDAP